MSHLRSTSSGHVAVHLLCVAVLILTAIGCDQFAPNTEEVTLSGRVINASTQQPVQEAVVTISFVDDDDEEHELTTVTDSDGHFSKTVEVEGAVDVILTASKSGVSVERNVRVSSELDPITDLRLELTMGEGEVREPGRPTSIILAGQSTEVIRVQESGGTSVARLTFQVVDSTGTPINLDQAVDVDFRFGQQPGGATLTPETVTTGEDGKATVNVSSGTTSGTVQVVAETEKADGSSIRSKPVSITIHGGLPNECHFSLQPDQTNFAGLRLFNLSNPITVLLGDKYGNPVVPGTAVYFSTNAGLIDGSIQTDAEGKGVVNLVSARPLPDGGVGTVRAETVGTDDSNSLVEPDFCPDPARSGNENIIFKTKPIVFSGHTEVEVTPTSAQLDQTYEMTLWDAENNNPLSPQTSFTVTAEGTQVKAVGHTDVTLDDTEVRDDNNDGFGPEDVVKGDGITQFTFRVAEDPDPDSDETPSVEAITIKITSPNGDVEVVLTPGGTTSLTQSTQTVETSAETTVRTDGSKAVVTHDSQRK